MCFEAKIIYVYVNSSTCSKVANCVCLKLARNRQIYYFILGNIYYIIYKYDIITLKAEIITIDFSIKLTNGPLTQKI